MLACSPVGLSLPPGARASRGTSESSTHWKSITGKRTRSSPNSGVKHKTWLPPYCLVFMFCGMHISALQIHSHAVLASKLGFWRKRCILRKKSKACGSRQASAPAQRPAFPSTDSSTERGVRTDAFTTLTVLGALPAFP